MTIQTGAAVTVGKNAADMLSEAARRALSNTPPREGAVVDAPAVTVQELQMARYVGPQRGLTRAGLIVRDRIVEAMFEEMF